MESTVIMPKLLTYLQFQFCFKKVTMSTLDIIDSKRLHLVSLTCNLSTTL